MRGRGRGGGARQPGHRTLAPQPAAKVAGGGDQVLDEQGAQDEGGSACGARTRGREELPRETRRLLRRTHDGELAGRGARTQAHAVDDEELEHFVHDEGGLGGGEEDGEAEGGRVFEHHHRPRGGRPHQRHGQRGDFQHQLQGANLEEEPAHGHEQDADHEVGLDETQEGEVGAVHGCAAGTARVSARRGALRVGTGGMAGA